MKLFQACQQSGAFYPPGGMPRLYGRRDACRYEAVMPSGLAEQLTKEELADLLAFLKVTRW